MVVVEVWVGDLMKLNLGCGPVQAPGWVNVDGSQRAWLVARAKWLDRLVTLARLLPPSDFDGVTFARLDKPFPWPDNSAEAVYAGEVLEHFTEADGLDLLRRCWRVLAPGGHIRVRVPDNERFWRNYLAEIDATRRLPRKSWTAGHARWVHMFFRDICVRRQFVGSFGHFHKHAYDEIALSLALEEVGFTNVRRMALHDSGIGDVAAVEVRDDLIVEGVKPSVPS